MQPNHFVVLTGHLNDYPLSDLVGILRHQRKTGRLLIEYAKGPAMFFFKDGELVDVQLENLSGLQAICVALAQPGAPFNFNPLIQPSRHSIESSLHKVVSELLGCWDEQALEIETTATIRTLPEPESMPESKLLPSAEEVVENRPGEVQVYAATGPERLANRHGRVALGIAAAVLVMLVLSTVIGVTVRLTGMTSSAVPEERNSGAPSSREHPSSRAESKTEGMLRADARERETGAGSDRSSRRDRLVSANRKNDSASSRRLLASSASSRADEKRGREARHQSQSVKVIMQIENGRVANASIANHKSDMDAYEALALRIARQRRYPSTQSGRETVTIQVSQPN